MKTFRLPVRAGLKKLKSRMKFISPAAWRNIRKILFCVAAVAVAAVPAVFVNTVYGYLPALVILTGIAVSGIYILVLKKTLEYEEMSDLRNCRRGTQIEFSVRIRNRFLLVYPRLELFFYISDLFGDADTVTESVITLAPREKRQFDFGVRFDHIGTYSAGLRKIRIHDLIGLFCCEIHNTKEYKVDVSPRIFDAGDIYISDTTMTESQKMVVPALTDGSDYAGVREYVWGDPIKNIHWKLSARTETYMTKQFESYGMPGMDIVLNFTAPASDPETMMTLFDGIVETGLSVAEYARDLGIDCSLIYVNRKGDKARVAYSGSTDHLSMIRDMPAITSGRNGTTGTDLLREESSSIYSQGNIVFCTAEITDELGDIILQIRNRKKNPLLFVILPAEMTEEERRDALRPLGVIEQAGLKYHVISSAEELGGGEKQ